MTNIVRALDSVVAKLSDENYAQSLAFYRLWHDIGQTYNQIPSNWTFANAIWNNRGLSSNINPQDGKLIHPGVHLILRFIGDLESDQVLASHTSGLQSRLCSASLRGFFNGNMGAAATRESHPNSSIDNNFFADVNLIAHWANLGYVEEAAIRDHILQSLISDKKLYDHQADALVILFKIAGATFEAYADPSVVDRCFDLLKHHKYFNLYEYFNLSKYQKYVTDEINRYAETRRGPLQEVLTLRERGWEGLPPPPVFSTGKPKQAGTDQQDPATTPIVVPLGLPNTDPVPQVPQAPPLGSVTPETDTILASSATPVTQSPSISIATLSDFTIADASDDESFIDPTIADTSGDEHPVDPIIADTSDEEHLVDPTAITPHEAFYFEDGNAEVLCGNTLFRVHTTILSFHSPTLRQMFSQTNLAAAESPNGCPRIPVSDTPQDFATLLKTIYLPVFTQRNKVPDFTTFSSLLRVTAKYEMPAVRSQMLDIVRDAYPKTFEGLTPGKPIGESAFVGPTPHPNEVLNHFVQQKITSALPMAYYMAARRGPDSLMDGRLPANARLPLKTLQVAVKGLLALREMELNEAYGLILGSKGSCICSQSTCPSRSTAGPGVSDAHQKVIDRMASYTHSGTKLLQVLSMRDFCGDDCFGFCESCVERWEAGHADVRRKVWGMLPDVFGLKG